MTLYRIVLELLSPLGTPLQSDTLFGHLCWIVVHRDGAGALQSFLEPFRRGHPPFVLSDGFPSGILPRPLLPRLVPPEPQKEELDLGQVVRKAAWLTIEQFRSLSTGGSLAQFISQAEDGRVQTTLPSSGWVTVQTYHATLDRRSGRTGGGESVGRLYSTIGWLPLPTEQETYKPLVDIYARATEEGIVLLEDLLSLLSKVGYGKDKSVGRGSFRIASIQPMPELDECPGADGFVSLSSFVPAPGDPTEGRWRLRTKYGKLGEEWALSELPFKRPLLQMVPGAAFYTGAPPRLWYGTIVEGIAPAHPEVIQNCQTVALPVRWE